MLCPSCYIGGHVVREGRPVTSPSGTTDLICIVVCKKCGWIAEADRKKLLGKVER